MNDTSAIDRICPQILDFIQAAENNEARFNELALTLFREQVQQVPAYRRICEHRGTQALSPSHWNQIPAVPTTAFKDLELTSLEPSQRTHVFYSSGTTEQRPSRHFHNADSLAIYEASLIRWFTAKFLKDAVANLRFISLTPPADLAPNSSLVHMFSTIAKTHKTVFTGNVADHGSWAVNFEKTVSLLELFCNENEPVAIVGTAFGFVHLLDHLTELKKTFKLPASSRVMETGGYKGRSRTIPKPELHAVISKQLELPASQIISEYGMSELSSQGYDNPDRVFRFPPWARVQIISPETNNEVAIGETGLVRIYDLANVYSVMAIQTEDLAIRRADGFELIGRASESEPRGCSLMATEGSLH
jgi:phenylacetate-coenzyme A ligase PaaK-like adenylate-forming protein